MSATSIVWFRRDLRVEDNPALCNAAERGPVLPVYIHAPDDEAPWSAGAASRAWLHQSLKRHAARLGALGAPLMVFAGDSLKVLKNLIRETGAGALFYNRLYEPEIIARDRKIDADLKAQGVEVRSFKSALIFEPQEIENRSGKPFRVFTPFYRHCLARLPESETLPAPSRLQPSQNAPKDSLEVDTLELMPSHSWASNMLTDWRPGAGGAVRELDLFLESAVDRYPSARDLPAVRGVSRLSPHLHHGELSPRTIVSAVRAVERSDGVRARKGAEAFLRQLIWREFGAHLLAHFPSLPTEPFDQRFKNFSWKKDRRAYLAWTKGKTGYPLVDAGMRELWATGWMHNRVRMVVASFLTKHLLIHWVEGARWFWDTLVDADLANNTMGWQWTAGCGVDAAPYFRIFNPVAQGERFDRDGRYVRRWVPELSSLPDRFLHRPFEAGAAVLSKSGIRLGVDYPEPLVGHKEARERALAAYDRVRGG